MFDNFIVFINKLGIKNKFTKNGQIKNKMIKINKNDKNQQIAMRINLAIIMTNIQKNIYVVY